MQIIMNRTIYKMVRKSIRPSAVPRMDTMIWAFRYFALAFSLSLLGSCSVKGDIMPSELNGDLFVDPSKHVGEHVVIRGFLRYGFENRNLFPSERHVNHRMCLPMLIRTSRTDLIENAKARDGTTVSVRGEVVNVATPGMVAVSTCKTVGIEVDSIN